MSKTLIKKSIENRGKLLSRETHCEAIRLRPVWRHTGL